MGELQLPLGWDTPPADVEAPAAHSTPMNPTAYTGVLFIGDPHMASRVQGFRKDDYPRVILGKLTWCLAYAREQNLLPAVLGDWFHQPRDNANWLLGEVLALLGRQEVVAIYGNHDCRENELGDDDSLMVIVQSGRVQMVDGQRPWRGIMRGQAVVVGGTPWGCWPAKKFARADGERVFWMTHHDVKVPGYEEQGRFEPFAMEGVDLVINGHIHRRLEEVTVGSTTWLTPGNITRVSRGDATKAHLPSVLRVDITDGGWEKRYVEVPHEPFDAVFHGEVVEAALAAAGGSAFVAGLAELQARKTETGAGLLAFLKLNVGQFEEAVGKEILALAQEVTHGDQ